MYILLDAVLAFFVLSCICCTACMLYSYLLRPCTDFGSWTVVFSSGSGEGLEQRVRSLMWLRSCGVLRCNVAVAGDDLDEEGRALALRLAERYPGLTLCSRQELDRLREV